MKKLIGPLILILTIAVVGVWQYLSQNKVFKKAAPPKQVTISAFVGGEKMYFLKNPKVNAILQERYGITLNSTKAGSIEMVKSLSTAGKDALWPSNQIAVEIFRKRGGSAAAVETIFNSPIVLYTYALVAEALIKAQIVNDRDGTFYITNFNKLVQLIKEHQTWKDIGLEQLYGNIAIFSTDPSRSNSGNMFCGLLANMFNHGQVVSTATVDTVLGQVKEYFNLRGYMEHSSKDIFKNFINTGVGAKPIIVGYESQLIEFSIENEKFIDYLRQKIRILYPIPTIWSSHPIIALTSNGKKLIQALRDEELQKIAWEKHGFRSGLMGVETDPAILKVGGVPKEITAVVPMPAADIMEKFIEALKF